MYCIALNKQLFDGLMTSLVNIPQLDILSNAPYSQNETEYSHDWRLA